MQKVIVIGSPGAGKSTFSRKLRDVTHLPLHYLDMLWHKPDRTTVTTQEFDDKLKDILMRDQWILDGNHGMRQNLTRNLSNLSLTFPKKVYLEYTS